MIAALLRHHARRHRIALAALAAALGLFLFLFTRIAPPPERISSFSALLEFMPVALRELFGIDPGRLTTRGIVGFGFAHPFTLVALGAWTARVAAGGLAGEIGSGTMDLLAARPVRRWQLVAGTATALWAGLVALVAAMWIGLAVGLATRSLGVAAGAYAGVAAALLLLFAAFGGIALLVSALARAAGPALGVVVAVMAGSYALDYLARALPPLAWTRWLTLFTWYRPQEIFQSGLPGAVIALYGGVAGAGLAGAIALFARRDL